MEENPAEKQTELELEVEELEVTPDPESEKIPEPEKIDPEPEKTPDLSAPMPPQAAPPVPGMTQEQAFEKHQGLNGTFEALRTNKEAIEAEMTKVQREMALIHPYLDDRPDTKANQKAIIHYINSQRELRKTRMERRNEVLKGFKMHDILPTKGSKLDESMTRKRGFGTQRPHYPAQTANQ